MAMFGGYKHGFLIWIAHFLAFCGFGVLIGGLAALQARCNDIPGANPTSYFVHYMPYNTSCHKYFRYTWWITFFQLFVWGAVAFHLFSRTIHKFRVGLIGFLAVVTVLLMDTANTYLWYTSAPSVPDSLFIKRTKVVFAGAIISAIANMLQIWLMGYHDEKASWEERTGNYNKGYGYGETHTTTTAALGTTPVATNVQSTTTAAVV